MEKTATILHLEDSDLDAELIADRLAKTAPWATVDRVVSRIAYVDALVARSYDLILSDFQVPGMAEFDALDLALERQPDTPFIYLSGALGEEVAVDALRRGARDYVLKERMTRLAPAIERALAESRDRAKQRETERERERLGQELARREEELRVLTDAIPALISYVDTDFRYRFANRAYEAWFGRPRSEVVGSHMSEVLGDSAFRVIKPAIEAALRGEPTELETFAPYKDGGGRHIHVHYVPRFENGAVVGCFVLVNDITASKNDSLERLRLVNNLKEADRRKDEFLATLAHELRNPLAPIYSGLRLMRVAKSDAKVVDEARDMIERQATQLRRLVDDLMDVSRISRGLMELRKEVVDLSAVVNAAVEASRPLIDQRGHHLTVELPAEPAKLEADPIRLTQVLMNLLNNAAKYSDRDGKIHLAARSEGGDLVISVKDRGIGIPADRLIDIFEIFSQVDRSMEKSHGGLGIGLSLVKRLIELHGGHIEAHSQGPGRGAEFIIKLPARRESAGQCSPGGAEISPSNETHRILVVDDNREAADSLSQLLGMMGNETWAAYDGESAISAASEFQPEVVLLDIGMPRLNGLDACRRIRAQPWGRDMTLIALTGWGQEEDIRRSREAGFDEHMVKPVDADRLMSFLATRGARAISKPGISESGGGGTGLKQPGSGPAHPALRRG